MSLYASRSAKILASSVVVEVVGASVVATVVGVADGGLALLPPPHAVSDAERAAIAITVTRRHTPTGLRIERGLFRSQTQQRADVRESVTVVPPNGAIQRKRSRP